jgi:hypothetical protein
MEHHHRLRREWANHRREGIRGKLNRTRVSARETSFIKGCMATYDNLLADRIPELPCFNTLRVANKNAFLGVRLQSFPLLLVHQHIS